MAAVDASSASDDQVLGSNNNDEVAVTIKEEKDATKEENDSNKQSNDAEETNNDETKQIWSANDPDDNNKTNLIVNYLPQQMSDDDFEELFKKYGEFKSCKIVRNRVSGYSYGFGFVDYQTHEQALKAIEELNGHEIDNKKIKVAFARPAGQDIKQANLYVKNVPNDWTQDDVKKVFEPYGNIIQVRVLGNNRGVAFVLYDLRKQAEEALEALNGKTIDGCEAPFEIKFAADKKTEKAAAGSNSTASSNGNKNSSVVPKRRERGHRGGRNRNNHNHNHNNNNNNNNNNGAGNSNNRDNQRQGRQRSFFDKPNNRQNNNYEDRRGNQGGYGGGAQYGGNFSNHGHNNMNGAGPVRHQPNRNNRFAPFVPMIAPMPSMAGPGPQMNGPPHLAANPAAYGFAAQPPMIPLAMLQPQQMAPMQAVNQAGQMTGQMQGQIPAQMAGQMAGQVSGQMSTQMASQMASQMPGQLANQMAGQMGQNPMAMYGAAPVQMNFAPVATAAAMNNMYSVASSNMNNAANMQPQIGQPMAMQGALSSRMNNVGLGSGSIGGGGGYSDDGVTLFVYNIGPDTDESELRSMFNPYGLVVKCNVVRKTPGGETKGFGFVTMKDREQANSAIAGLNGSMRNGRALQVSLKK